MNKEGKARNKEEKKARRSMRRRRRQRNEKKTSCHTFVDVDLNLHTKAFFFSKQVKSL